MRLPGVLVKKGSGVCSRIILEKRRCEIERERIREKGGEAGAGADADAEAGCGVKCTFLYICIMYANIHGFIFPGLFHTRAPGARKWGIEETLPCTYW